MSNPLSLLPIALAAGGGDVDGLPAARLVAAGFTLLQRSAPLVRALAGRRSALLLPPSPAVLAALAASDGHGAMMLPTQGERAPMAALFETADVGAVFTTRALSAHVPGGNHAVVLLDELPRAATVIARGAETTVDLGSHFGLDLEGEEDEGREEEAVVAIDATDAAAWRAVRFTHRGVFALARGCVDAASLLKGDRVLAALSIAPPAALACSMLGPLFAGAHVVTAPRFDAADVLHRVEHDEITVLIGTPDSYTELADLLEGRGRALSAPALRICICLAQRAEPALAQRWQRASGTELRTAVGVPDAPLALFNAPHFPNRPESLGVPFPGIQVAVRDAASGERVAAGTPGRLWLSGASLSAGAPGDAAGTSNRRDGWLATALRVRERPDGAFDAAE